MARLALVLGGLSAGGGLFAGCESDDEETVARLAEQSGEVFAQNEEGDAWEDAEDGHSFGVGSAVETGAGASARVELSPGGGLRLGEHSRVRFGRGERRVGLEIGGAEIEAEDEGFSVYSEIGEAEIEPDSRVAVRLEDGELRFEVLVGAATIEERGGEPRELVEGDSVQVGEASAGEPPADAAPAPDEVSDAAAQATTRASVMGDGARIREAQGAWDRLREGSQEVPAGAEISLDEGTAIELSRADARARIRGEAALEVGAPGEPIAVTSRGEARLAAGEREVLLEVPGGVIIARENVGGSRAEIAVDDSGDTDIEAERGRVVVEGGEGDRSALSPGERARVSRQGRVREGRSEGSDGGEGSERPEDLPPPPSVADFSIRAGESPIVHAPSPPVAIRIRYPGACGEGGAVELARNREFSELAMVARGGAAAIVRAPRGKRYYRVRCAREGELGRARSGGVLRVRRNAGTARLPRRPPQTELEADGRRYTVHYQNHLPKLTFVWKDAPAREAYLHVVSEEGEHRSIEAPGGKRTVGSGALGEGRYKWWIQAAEDEESRSPRTSLKIAFDNAADSAHVREPGVGESWDRSAVRVRGTTLEGWAVSAAGRDLDTDEHRRFSARVSLPGSERALAIRFAHPERGVHYYVRRPGGG